jgi:hypothetical protein
MTDAVVVWTVSAVPGSRLIAPSRFAVSQISNDSAPYASDAVVLLGPPHPNCVAASSVSTPYAAPHV